MRLIATQPYIKVIRKFDRIEKKVWEEKRWIYLFDCKIVTSYREFPLEEVLDISYRRIGTDGGLLLIHTTGGLFSYTLKSNPEAFIYAFESIKRN